MVKRNQMTTRLSGEQFIAANDEHEIPMKGGHPSPVDYLVASLGGCAGLTLKAILEKKRIRVDELEVSTDAKWDENNRYLETIDLTFKVRAEGLTEQKLQSSIALSHKHCPVHQTFEQNVNINTDGEILT